MHAHDPLLILRYKTPLIIRFNYHGALDRPCCPRSTPWNPFGCCLVDLMVTSIYSEPFWSLNQFDKRKCDVVQMCIYRTWGNSNEERERDKETRRERSIGTGSTWDEGVGRGIIHVLDKKKKKKKKKLPSKKRTF